MKTHVFRGISLSLLLASTCAVARPTPAHAQAANHDVTLEQILVQMRVLQGEVKKLEHDQAESNRKLAHAQAEIRTQAEQLKRAQAQVAAAQGQAQAAKSQAAAAQGQAQAAKTQAVAVQGQVQAAKTEAAASLGNWHLQGDAHSHSPIPAFVSNDGRSFVRLGGRLVVDGTFRAVPNTTTKNGAGVYLPSGGNEGDIEFRRTRIELGGQLDTNWIFNFEYDFTKNGASGIRYAWAGWHGSFRAPFIGDVYNSFKAGNQFLPFGFHESSKFSTFAESSLATNAFRPQRTLTLAGQTATKYWNFWYGVSAGHNPSGTSPPYGGEGNLGVSGDLAITPINEPGRLIRIGNSIAYNQMATTKTATGTEFSTTPEAKFYGAKLVDTGSVSASGNMSGVRSFIVYEPNLAFQYNSLTVRGDYWIVKETANRAVSSAASLNDGFEFTGWGAEAAYWLTGEIQPYDTKTAQWDGIKPLHRVTQGGWGAWQVAARIDGINLNDRNHGINGGRETNVTAAVNWWPMAFSEFSVDYIKVLGVSGGSYSGYAPSIVLTRLQFLF